MKTLITTLGLVSASLFPILLDSAIKGLILLSLSIAIIFLLRRSTASTRHLVWISGLAALLALPLLSLYLPKWHVLPDWRKQEQPAVATITKEEAPVMVDVALPATPSLSVEPALIEHEITQAPLQESDWTWQQLMAPIWGGGVLVLLMRLLIGSRRLTLQGHHGKTPCHEVSKITQQLALTLGIRRKVRVILDAEQSMPMTWGILRPYIQLPREAEQWEEARLRSVLLHELSHVKRFDPLTQLLVQLACAVHWFNPLVWYAARRIEFERERACDDLVLSHGIQASEYAENLLQTVTHTKHHLSPQAGLAMARLSSLENRLKAILDDRVNRRRLSPRILIVCALLGILPALPMAMLDAAAEETSDAPTNSQEPTSIDQNSADLKWLRRMTLDLTGLPPTSAQVDAFLQDLKAEPKQAREKAIRSIFGKANIRDADVSKLLKDSRKTDIAHNSVLDASDFSTADPVTARKLESVQMQLEVARLNYGPNHPNVLELKAMMTALQKTVQSRRADDRHDLKHKKQQLRNLSKYYSETHPQIVQLNAEIKVLRAQLEKYYLQHESQQLGIPFALLRAVRDPGKSAGIGVALKINEGGYPQIQRLIPDMPASNSGKVKVNDLILAIKENDSDEWLSLQHLKLETAIKTITGAAGTEISLSIRRGQSKEFEVKMTRKSLAPQNAHSDAPALDAVIGAARDVRKREISAKNQKIITITPKHVPLPRLISQIRSLQLKDVILIHQGGTKSFTVKGPLAVTIPLMEVIKTLDSPAFANPENSTLDAPTQDTTRRGNRRR